MRKQNVKGKTMPKLTIEISEHAHKLIKKGFGWSVRKNINPKMRYIFKCDTFNYQVDRGGCFTFEMCYGESDLYLTRREAQAEAKRRNK